MSDEPKSLLGRNAIVAATDRRETVLEIEEWGGSVRLLEPVGDDRIAFERASRAMARGETTPSEYAAIAASLAIVDQDGERLFKEEAQVAQLRAKSKRSLTKILDAMLGFSRVNRGGVAITSGEFSGGPISDSDSD